MRRHSRKPDRNAAARLFELYEQKMYRIAFAILNDEGQAEDAVMDAFERVLKRPIEVEPESEDAKRIMLAAVKRSSIDLYRRNARERRSTSYVSEVEIVAGGLAEPEHSNEGCAEDLLEILPGGYRDVLRERLINDRSVKDTANELGISQANVRKRQQRAIESLRSQLGASNGR